MVNGRLYNAQTMNEVGNYKQNRAKFYFEKWCSLVNWHQHYQRI